MTKRRPPWFVPRNDEELPYAFFISHVAEDAAEVGRLKSEIEDYSGRGARTPLRCFLDVANWTIGNENSAVIRKHLLLSAHMVAWVSPAYLQSARGWVWMEFAYAELIELSLNHGKFDLARPFIVPVFRDVSVQQLERTPLVRYWERKLVLPDKEHPVGEIARRLVDFHEQEKQQLRRAEE